MTGKKIKALVLCGAFVLLPMLSSCSPDGDTYTKEYTYESTDPGRKGTFPETVEHEGRKYVITDMIDLSVTDQRKVLEKTVETDAPSLEDIPGRSPVTVDGKVFYAKLGEVTDIQHDVPVTRHLRYEESFRERFTSPSGIPEHADVNVELPEGTAVIKATLESVSQTSEYEWRDTDSITAVWEGDRNADAFVLDGTDLKIPYDRNTPTWPGYETRIIRSLGLPSSNYRVTGGWWTDTEKDTGDGKLSRAAEYPVQIYSADFLRTYTADYETIAPVKGIGHYWIEEDRAQKRGLEMKDDPEHGLQVRDVYSIKAIVRYALVKEEQ